MKKPLIVLTGPTAVGKTKLSIALAKAVNGEIISADSMQVYRHMDIGTAKVTSQEMQGVSHHMIDVAEPSDSYSVARYVKEADACVQHIGQVEHRRHDLGDAIAVGDLRDVRRVDGVQHHGLGQLVQDDDGQGEAVGGEGETRDFHAESRLAGSGTRAKRESDGGPGALRPFPHRFGVRNGRTSRRL